MAKLTFGDVAGPATAVLGMGINALSQGAQDRRQLRQQEKLNEQAFQMNRRTAENQKMLDLQMWKDTNYSAQVAEAKKAGMSISSLYGGSGASGATTGGGAGNGVSAGTATDPSAAINAKTGMALQAAQLALMGAQKRNIDADTANKTAGAGKATAEATGQGIENRGLEVDTANKEALKEELRDAMMGEAKSKTVKGVIDDQTEQTVINGIKADVAAKKLEEQVQQGKINLTKAQITEIKEKIAQGWKGLEFQGTDKVTGKYLEELIKTIKGLF